MRDRKALKFLRPWLVVLRQTWSGVKSGGALPCAGGGGGRYSENQKRGGEQTRSPVTFKTTFGHLVSPEKIAMSKGKAGSGWISFDQNKPPAGTSSERLPLKTGGAEAGWA